MVDVSGNWYHGRTAKSTVFDERFTGKGADQEGPGFYFTKNYDVAFGYASPGGVIITAKLSPRKLVPLNKPPKRKEILEVISKSSALTERLNDWNEDPRLALKEAVDVYADRDSAKDAFESVWFDFFPNHPADYLRAMVSLGYDGNLAEHSSENIVIYNPRVIEVLDVENVGPTASLLRTLSSLI